MKPLDNAIKVINATYDPRAAIFWTGGKDSTVMLHIIRSSVGGIISNPIVVLDSQDEFPEIYSFIKKYTKEWNLDVRIFKYLAPTANKARLNKIKALKSAIKKLSIEKAYIAIRSDESEARSGEQYLSLREDHTRFHPILDFTLKDIWKYIKKYNVPYCALYDKGYKSLGEKSFTKPTKGSERSGREQEKERVMKTLRKMGYF